MAKTSYKDVPVARLIEAVSYDPDSGSFTWRVRPVDHFTDAPKRDPVWLTNNWNSRLAGRPAFTGVGSHGYKNGVLFGHRVLAHRCAAAILTGEWPPVFVDHINGDRLDNRAANLRLASSAESVRNRASFGATCEYVGVYWSKHLGGYIARVRCNGVSYYCGFSKNDPEKVARARDKKALELFGPYARLNFPEE